MNSRKDKSLRVMSQKFVMLFLVSTPQIVSLEIAAKILIGEDHVEDLDKSKFKSKCHWGPVIKILVEADFRMHLPRKQFSTLGLLCPLFLKPGWSGPGEQTELKDLSRYPHSPDPETSSGCPFPHE